MLLFAFHPDNARVSGHLIETAQAALWAKGIKTGALDGVFGARTEAGLRKWQETTGRAVTGALSIAEWEALTGLPAPSLRDICIQISAALDGNSFRAVSGGRDGMDLIWGYSGFALTGTLPNLLAEIDADTQAGPEARAIFGKARWAALLTAASGTKRQKLAFAQSLRRHPRKRRLRRDWEQAFRRLGGVPSVQRLQLSATEPVWQLCVEAMADFEPEDALSVGMIYDACVQHGAISLKRRDLLRRVAPTDCPQERRDSWAETLTRATAPRLRDGTRARRALFAAGSGFVQGAVFDLDHWGFAAFQSRRPSLEAEDLSGLCDDLAEKFSATPLAEPDVIAAVDWMRDVHIPVGLNAGLRHAPNAYLVAHLGLPRGDFDQHCRQPTNPSFRTLCDFDFQLAHVGRVDWALRPARESFAEVLDAVARRRPGLFELLGHTGMGGCRYVRGSTSALSNHSFGMAIDISLGGQPQSGAHDRVSRGMLELIEIAHGYKWFSGATFRRADKMHLEVSRELFDAWLAAGDLPSGTFDTETVEAMQQGHRGEDVRELQQLLNRRGLGLRVDGLFGAATANALKWFQNRNGLPPCGLVDKKTLLALRVAAPEVA